VLAGAGTKDTGHASVASSSPPDPLSFCFLKSACREEACIWWAQGWDPPDRSGIPDLLTTTIVSCLQGEGLAAGGRCQRGSH